MPIKDEALSDKMITPVRHNVGLPKALCLMCGETDPLKFHSSKDYHKGILRKLPYCKSCIRDIYDEYLSKYGDDINLAIYYTCRKVDMPYNHSNFLGAVDSANKNPSNDSDRSNKILSAYLKGLSFAEANGWGESFDDSQGESEIEHLAAFDAITKVKRQKINSYDNTLDSDTEYEIIEYDTDVLQSKWGYTFENWELAYLEGEYLDWEEKLNGINDKTIDILVKQICYQLLDIYKDRQCGAAVDKKIKTLRELMNDSGLLEKQNKASAQRKNVGMTIRDIEFHKPIPENHAIFDDVDGCKNYIFGAAGCYFKADGKENIYTKFYDEWMKDYSIDLITDMIEGKDSNKDVQEIENSDNDTDNDIVEVIDESKTKHNIPDKKKAAVKKTMQRMINIEDGHAPNYKPKRRRKKK